MDDKNVGMPRWVKIGIGITVAVVLLFVVALLSGQKHGPGRHKPSQGLPASAVATWAAQPGRG